MDEREVEMLVDAIRAVMPQSEQLDIFEGMLLRLAEEHQTDDIDLRIRYAAKALAFAAVMTARCMMWHVDDHEGYHCVREGVPAHAGFFAEALTMASQEIAREKGYKDPFEVLSVNEQVVKDTLAELEADKK